MALAAALVLGCAGGRVGDPDVAADPGAPADVADDPSPGDEAGTRDVVEDGSQQADAPDAAAPDVAVDDGTFPDVHAPDAASDADIDADAAPPRDDGPSPDATDPDPGPLTAAQCLADQLPESGVPPVDYDQFHPILGTHCKGTNHQDIQGVQRVVFAGDSITTGTPPTPAGAWYRNLLADALATRFNLKPPGILWRNLDMINGVTIERNSGDFWCCAKFGARTDDMTDDPHRQLVTCNPEDQRSKRTLIVMTVGGNDIFKWAQDMVDGVPVAQLWATAEKAVRDLEEAIHWVVDDPATFPGGVYVVFANTFAFNDQDSGNDLAKCPGAGIISMNTALVDPEFQAMATWFTTEYMRIAVETGTDMIFLGEAACGHGYMRDDPEGRCYRGPGADLWLDVTCMHPGLPGHAGIADLFLSVITE